MYRPCVGDLLFAPAMMGGRVVDEGIGLSDGLRAAEIAGPPTELIFGDWYPAMRTRTLRAKKTAKAMLLGVPLLVGRKNDGKLFAMRDLCPHRGIPLSAGGFDGESVACKDHGLRVY